MKIFYKKSVWVLISIYVSIWLVIALVAGVILDGYKRKVNSALGLSGYRTETIGDGTEDTEYFKSEFVQKDANGQPLYTTDTNGYKHQVYDDAALRNAAIAKADQVQREGTTILWNSDANGLPLAKGNKVSVFSHSSVDWVYSGGGSGYAYVKGAANVKQAFTSAGLGVNDALWNFYESGDGKSYTRTARYTMNEVPWSKYTDAVKNSFASFGDAAIIVLSRQAGEGSVAQGGAFDVTTTDADTPSGDYYDMSNQERKLLEEVVKLKRSGTFKKVIVLLNTPTGMWFENLLKNKADIDCCMWVSQTGYEGLNEVGRILVGDSTPSGHLADTFLQTTRSDPAYINSIGTTFTNARDAGLKNVGYQGSYMVYAEGIYVGYKYYETRYEDAVLGRGNATSAAGKVNSAGNWTYGEEVAFPFGYGLSFTKFEYSGYNVAKNAAGDYEVTLTVKNVGSKAGKDAVQIYIQKPYTRYDVDNGIEQAAVNLCGYYKTKELAPNESEQVTVTVRDDAFKTYDANNKKTYIRERTEGENAYYITAAEDAHQAINNILAAKGKTPANTSGVMDAEGNTSLVKRFDFAADDFETYAKSEYTGNDVTNRFDDADWNKYSNKTDGTVTYLSRNDWQATYPTEVIKIALSEAMVGDLSWDKPVEADPADKMPLYGQAHTFNLIDLKGQPYDHGAWETLLDQLTLEEQIHLLGSAYHGTGAIPSITKPADTANDGPLGIRVQYKTNSTARTMSYPNTVLLAASYNDKLVEEVGRLMGEDMLHVGVNGLYGPGANIHRTTYAGRNYEYYSEDGFLSGIMLKYHVKGIQSTGCYVNVKHIALNDQENSRYGIGVWANEQSIREIYLSAFEYAATEGDCTGFMSAFNRLGTTWCGAHKGLCTDVLRGEWGFDGMVISDCAWRAYMGVVDGVMAGNDYILDDADLTQYYLAETNPTVAKAIRESTHRVLYVLANGNVMNGLSANTRIYEVREWWQDLVTGIQIGLGVLDGILILITILCFVFQNKIRFAVETKAAGRIGKMNQTQQDENVRLNGFEKFMGIGSPLTAGRIAKTAICILLCLGIAVGAFFIGRVTATPSGSNGGGGSQIVEPTDSSGSKSGSDSSGSSTGTSSSMRDQLDGSPVTYRFEAECAEIVTDIATFGKGIEPGKTVSSTKNPSGDSYVYNLSKEGSATLTFRINAAADCKAVISLCMGLNTERKLSNMFQINLNGATVSYDSSLTFPKWSTTQYFDWYELDVALVNLKSGDNTLTFTKATTSLNFDYLALTSGTQLADSREVANGGHKYEEWILTREPTLTSEGKIETYCEFDRHHLTETLPVISEANGYVKRVITAPTATTSGTTEWSIEKAGKTYTFTTEELPTGAKSFIFEAESATFTGSAKRANDTVYGTSGNAYAGSLAGATWTITFEITSDTECDAVLYLRVGRRNDRDVYFTQGAGGGKTVTVNGEQVTVSDDVVFPQIESESKYMNWEEFEIVTIHLTVGKTLSC
ncbi:MAG: glycoside hydrolase family 3 C-terminal domain-containing protein [Clostridia bacterium]|nr:glycoside hydrolase family 3 C-terminal domain-containing protein [Clostridia bacterium]